MSRGSSGHSTGHSGGSHSSTHSHHVSSHSSLSSSRGRSSHGYNGFPFGGQGIPSYRPSRGFIGFPRQSSYNNYGPIYTTKAPFWFYLIFFAFLFMVFSFCMFLSAPKASSIPASTVNREPISGSSWNNDCVHNNSSKLQINENSVSRQIQSFYKLTGIQPWFYAVSIDENTDTEEEREYFAQNYFTDVVKNEDAFLWVYFDDPYSDECYSSIVEGYNTTTVMDAQAEEVFWSYWDYWFNSDENDSAFVCNVFNDTAKRIMTKSTTVFDIAKAAVVLLIVFAAVGGIIAVIVIKRKHEAQRAAETERILNASLEELENFEDLDKK